MNHVFRIFCLSTIPLFLLLILLLPLTVVAEGTSSGAVEQNIGKGLSGQIMLTEQEQAWLNQRHAVRVRISEFPPHMMTLPEPRGISVDYLKLIGRRFGINFIFVKTTIPWQESVEDLEGNRKWYDLLITMKRTPERERKIAFTQDYLFAPWVIVNRTNSPYVSRMEDLNDKSVAVERGYVVEGLIKNKYPRVKIVIVKNTLKALNAVASGSTDAYIGNLTVATYFIQNGGLYNLRIAAPTTFGNHDQAMGVRSDWPELVSIINKALMAMPDGEKSDITRRWFSVKYEYGINKKKVMLWIVAPTAALSLIIIVIVTWNRRLKQEIDSRKALEAARKEDEIRLKRSETKFSTIFHTSPDVIVISEKITGRFLEVNDAFERIIGYSREEVIGHTALELGTWGSKELRLQMVEQLGNNKRLVNYQTLFRRKNGEVFPVLLSLELVEIDRVECFSISARDITEQEEIKEELRRSRDAAESSTRAKSEFLANMSHEIRTPMNAITGMAYLIQQTDLDTQQHNYVTRIRNAADLLLGIINDILDFSKIEAGKIELESICFDMRELIGSVNSVTTPHAEQKKLEISFSIHPNVPVMLNGDPLRLGQILNNLVSNAIKFTNKGNITITVAADTTSFADSIAITFSVADTGIGMNHEQLEQIFIPFTQADSSITRRFGGTGLGLSIVSRLLTIMGSELKVISEPESGSTFSFTVEFGLPSTLFNGTIAVLRKEFLVQTQSGKRPIVPDIDLKQLKNIRILLAEDNEVNQIVVQDMMRRLGAEVVTVNNGQEAVEAVKGSGPFDIVFMDIQMPEMNGYEATAVIRREKGELELPIIAMTAYAFNDERQRCLAVGMNDHVAKPIDPDQLYSVMLRWMHPEKVVSSSRLPSNTDDMTYSDLLPDSLPGIDVIAVLKRCGGNAILMQDIINNFVGQSRNVSDETRSAIESGDSDKALFIIHNIKGLSGTIGATSLSAITADLETAIKNRKEEEYSLLLTSMEMKLAQVIESAGILNTLMLKQPADEVDTPLPLEEFTSLLKSLHISLHNNSADARKIFAQIKCNIPLSERAELQKYIARLDFAKAGTILKCEAEKLGINLLN